MLFGPQFPVTLDHHLESTSTPSKSKITASNFRCTIFLMFLVYVAQAKSMQREEAFLANPKEGESWEQVRAELFWQ